MIRRTPPIVHHRIPIADADETDLLIWLPFACHFIQGALANGGIVFVHSTKGEYRAPTVIAAYRKPIPIGPAKSLLTKHQSWPPRDYLLRMLSTLSAMRTSRLRYAAPSTSNSSFSACVTISRMKVIPFIAGGS